MATLHTYELKGNKQSFANWISNLSPCETPFTSMLQKEQIDQAQYSWQTDKLSKAAAPAQVQEGSAATLDVTPVTTVVTNFTRIFRKAVRVSDTTKQIGLYGRTSELAYQLEKAGMEIKRDVEHYLLNSKDVGSIGAANTASKCAGIQQLIAAKASKDADTGAEVHFETAQEEVFTKEDIFKMTYNLYLVGSRANKIMVHPKHMHVFSDFLGAAAVATPHLHRMFDGLDNKYNAFVKSFRDPLGQQFEIIPNRHLPEKYVMFFNEKDWTQMILRAPQKVELGRTGSTEKFMIEMEVGLRHSNPFASGLLEIKAKSLPLPFAEEKVVKAPRKAKEV